MKLPISNRAFILLVVSLVIVISPRFDRLDRFGLDAYSTGGKPAAVVKADAQHYENHVLYFRGQATFEDLRKPWAYRPISPLVASFLPFDALTSINVLNLLVLFVGLLCLLKLFGILGFSAATSTIGGLFYTCSFPVFYYGAIGYIDPVLVGMMSVSTYLIFAGKDKFFFVSFLVGALIKETYIVILPVWCVYQLLLTEHSLFRTGVLSLILLVGFVAIVAAVRVFTPVGADYFWFPNSELINFNFFRLRSWGSFVLTFGVAGVLAVYYLTQSFSRLRDQPYSLVLLMGFLGNFAVFCYSMLSAYADGRYFWTAYPFMIPLACMQIDAWLNTSQQTAIKQSSD